MKRISAVLLCLVSGALFGVPAGAAVSESDAGHLVLSYTLPVKVGPAEAYRAVVDIARWWSSEHTYSGDARNLRLDPRAGGCWCETLKDGGVEHARVVLAMPGKLLRLHGGLGPLQAGAIDATLTFQFKPAAEGGGTTLAIQYVVGGFLPGGLDKAAGSVDGVLATQFARLEALLDTGSPEPAAKKSGG